MYKRIDKHNILFNNTHYRGGSMVGFFLNGCTYGIVKEQIRSICNKTIEILHMGNEEDIDRQFTVSGDYPKTVEGIFIYYK